MAKLYSCKISIGSKIKQFGNVLVAQMPSNFTKNQHLKTIYLVELVNFGGLNYFICV